LSLLGLATPAIAQLYLTWRSIDQHASRVSALAASCVFDKGFGTLLTPTAAVV
jgi:hypothetical protein